MAYTYYKIAAFSGGWHDGEIGVEVASQSVTGNYSVLNLVVRARKTLDVDSYNNGGAVEYIQVDGATKVSDDSVDLRFAAMNTWYTILSVSGVVVYHGTDGKKTISVKGYIATNVGAGTYNQTQSITLPQIARKSTATVTSTVEVNGTNEVTATITRADSSFTHKVTFSIGSYSQEYTGVATSQSYAIPLAWMNAIPNSVSGAAKCRVETFSGATSLGYNDYGFTITVPSTVVPVVTDISFARDTTGTDPFGTYAKGISKVSVSGISVTNQYSATTASFNTYLHLSTDTYTNGTLYTGASFISGVMPSAGTMRLTTVVTDSRGRESVAYYEDFTIYDYFAPILTVTAFRCDSSGVADPDGEYLSATMAVNVAPVNNDNTKTYVLEFKKTTDSSWTSIDTSALTGYSGTLNAVRSASSSYTWEVRASVTDKTTTITKTTEVGTKRVAFNVGSSGTAVAIGKVAETADLFEVDLDTQFNKGVNIGEDTLAEYIAANTPEGSTDGWFAAESMAYASATTITVASGAASRYSVGDRLKLTQTTVKYFMVVSVADTVLTITGGDTYTLANETITYPYFSHMHSPVGYPRNIDYVNIPYSIASPFTSASGYYRYYPAMRKVEVNLAVAHGSITSGFKDCVTPSVNTYKPASNMMLPSGNGSSSGTVTQSYVQSSDGVIKYATTLTSAATAFINGCWYI